MGKSKIKVVIIVAVVIILIATGCIFCYGYFKTDYFKKPDELFYKYLGEYTQKLSKQFENSDLEKYDEMLESNIYEQQIDVTPEFVTGLKTTDENRDNEINNLSLTAKGVVKKDINFLDYTIDVNSQDETLESISLLSNEIDDEINYGVKFDCLNKYVGVENKNISQIRSQVGLGANLSEKIYLLDQSKNLSVDDEQLSQLYNNYLVIMQQYFKNAKFSKNQRVITVNSKLCEVNELKVTMGQEEFNRLVIALLKQLKTDEIIGEKLKIIDQVMSLFNIQASNFVVEIEDTIDMTFNPEKDEDLTLNKHIEKIIDDLITQIENNNSSADTVSICVYEQDKTPLRFCVETSSKSYTLDSVIDQDNNILDFEYKQKDSVKENYIKIKRGIISDNDIMQISKKSNEEETVVNIIKKCEINEGNCQKDTRIEYSSDKSKLVLKVSDFRKVITKYEQKQLTSSNYICLNKLSDSELEDFKKQNNDVFIQYQNDFNQKINIENFIDVLKLLDIVDEEIEIDPYRKLTQTEVNKYNSNFEMLFGDSQKATDVIKLIEIMENNLEGFEVPNSNTLKFTLKQNTPNPVLANKAKEIINDPANSGYLFTVEGVYDETTDMLQTIFVKINNKK